MADVSARAIDRFWSKVRKSDGCWEWMAAADPRGYGKFGIGKSVMYAHRLSWTIRYGTIPAEMLVCHRCDNPRCVRPDHLFLGTAADNASDKVAKGRQRSHNPSGADHPRSLFSEDDVRNIRRRRESGETMRSIAESFGCHRSTIGYVVNKTTWKGVQ